GNLAAFDWSTEAAYQLGDFAGSRIRTYMLSASIGYTLACSVGKPRLAFGFDLASGDNDAQDDQTKTFHQLFPLGHAYLGWNDHVGRRNIRAFSMMVSTQPFSFLKMRLQAFDFKLQAQRDALYNAGGVPIRLDEAGQAGRDVGREIDAEVAFLVNSHMRLHIGMTYFFTGNFIKQTGPSANSRLFYLMVPVIF
ncbi:alginate export family protein, partial [bacterium]|nr:alginate export family protein [bacterium]